MTDSADERGRGSKRVLIVASNPAVSEQTRMADRFLVGRVGAPVLGVHPAGLSGRHRQPGWQQVSVGKHHGGELVDVHVADRLLEVWAGNELIKTLVRASGGEIRKKRAERTARTLT
jgi:hypothetical protein